MPDVDDLAVPLRRLRRALRRDTVLLVAGWLSTTLFLSAMVTGLVMLPSEPDASLVEAGPVVRVKVLSVRRVHGGESGDATMAKVARPADGAPADLRGVDELDPRPRAGGTVAVVADPDDPSYVLAADVDWHTRWWHYLLVIFVPLLVGGGFALALFGAVRFPGEVRRSLRKVTGPDGEVTVLEIDRPPRPEPGEDESSALPRVTLLVRDRVGAVWRWVVEWFEPEVADVGDRLPVAGEPREGAWMVGLVSPRPLFPATTLRRRQ